MPIYDPDNNEPPVEVIQGEARAREVLGKEAGYGGPIPLEIDGIALAVTSITAIRAMLAFARPAEPAPGAGGGELPADVRRLVIAARIVAFGDNSTSASLRELDAASEAFASRVPWVEAPETEEVKI